MSQVKQNFRPTVARINLAALLSNVRLAQKLAGPKTSLLAIIKADAYGHGAVEVAKTLASSSVKALGVATPEEGLELRQAGIELPILILGGGFGASGEELRHAQLTPVIYHRSQLATLAKGLSAELTCHLKIDTGMTRLGVLPEELSTLLKDLQNYPYLKISGVMTHLAQADETFEAATAQQLNRFANIEQDLQPLGDLETLHLANSAAILGQRVPEGHWARPGIMLYGANPHPRFKTGQKLKSVMNFETEIISLKNIPAGTAVSYGGDWVAKRPSRIAVLPVGYADGYLRALSNRGEVLIQGKRAPIAGRVCMDLTMVDVTDLSEVKLGEKVCLWGEDLPVSEVAEWAGTISYELLCGVSKRVPRTYHKTDSAAP